MIRIAMRLASTLALVLWCTSSAFAQSLPIAWPASAIADPVASAQESPPFDAHEEQNTGTRASRHNSGEPNVRVRLGTEIMFTQLQGSFEHERGRVGHDMRLGSEVPLDLYHQLVRSQLLIRVGDHNPFEIHGGYLRGLYREDDPMPKTQSHDGKWFQVGDEVSVRTEIQTAWVGARMLNESENVNFGPSFGGLWVSQRLAIVDRVNANNAAAARIEVFTPYVGFYLESVVVSKEAMQTGVEFEVRAATWLESGKAFGYLEFDGRVFVRLLEHVELWGGATWLGVAYKEHNKDDETMDFLLRGLSVGLALRF